MQGYGEWGPTTCLLGLALLHQTGGVLSRIGCSFSPAWFASKGYPSESTALVG